MLNMEKLHKIGDNTISKTNIHNMQTMRMYLISLFIFRFPSIQELASSQQNGYDLHCNTTHKSDWLTDSAL